MQNIEFFVKDTNGQLVPAKYLSYQGQFVFDPNQRRASTYPIFNGMGVQVNPWSILGPQNRWSLPLIVPKDYSIEKAWDFVQDIHRLSIQNGKASALWEMVNDYRTNGSHDLQRKFEGSHGEPVRAFKDAASFDVGFVGAASHLSSDLASSWLYPLMSPVEITEAGGGMVNVISTGRQIGAQIIEGLKNPGGIPRQFWNLFVDSPLPNIMGDYLNDEENSASIRAGAAFGERLAGISPLPGQPDAAGKSSIQEAKQSVQPAEPNSPNGSTFSPPTEASPQSGTQRQRSRRDSPTISERLPFFKMRYDGPKKDGGDAVKFSAYSVTPAHLSTLGGDPRFSLALISDTYRAPDLATTEKLTSLSPDLLPVSQAGRETGGSASGRSVALSADPVAAVDGAGMEGSAGVHAPTSREPGPAFDAFGAETDMPSGQASAWRGRLAAGARPTAMAMADEPQDDGLSPSVSREAATGAAPSRPRTSEGTVPVVVRFDERALERVVLNMVDRACSGPVTGTTRPNTKLRRRPGAATWC